MPNIESTLIGLAICEENDITGNLFWEDERRYDQEFCKIRRERLIN
jgi:hypothetical protein